MNGGHLLWYSANEEHRRPMKFDALFLALVLAVVACTEPGPQDSALSRQIAPSEVEWARMNGANAVNGTAVGGTTQTCAGQSANLIPDSAYAHARMAAIFGNSTKGTRAASLGPVKFERDDPLYVSTLRTTRQVWRLPRRRPHVPHSRCAKGSNRGNLFR
jgi:hypothetical protein